LIYRTVILSTGAVCFCHRDPTQFSFTLL